MGGQGSFRGRGRVVEPDAQERAEREVIVTWTESQPIHKDYVEYKVIDAALGVVERGTYVVKDATDEQPWLPNGPIKHTVTWTRPGCTAPSDGAPYALSAA